MNRFNRLLSAAALAVLAVPAHSATVALSADGLWHEFQVDSLLAPLGDELRWIDPLDSQPVNFEISIGAGYVGTLTVVDGAFAGDRFEVLNHGVSLGATAAVPVTDYAAPPADAGYDYDAALADPANFSSAVFTLTAGSYRIGGALIQSVLFNGAPLNASFGAVKLDVQAVPVPLSALSFGSGLATLLWSFRRRTA